MSDVGARHGRVAVGHPIDVASGEFFATRIDHELGGVVAISLGRRFSTNFLAAPSLVSIGDGSRFEPYGPGWRPSWLAELRGALGGGFVYTRADGTEFAIASPRGAVSFAATGRLVAPDHGLELQRVGPRHIRVVGIGIDRAAISLVFEEIAPDAYRLVAFEKNRNARLDVIYDVAGRPVQLLQRREQRGYELVYDPSGRIVEARRILPDKSRRAVVWYRYDAAGRLAAVQDSRGVACAYVYDAAGRIVRDEARGGKVYVVRYDRKGRCIYASGTDRYEERSLQFDDDGCVTWVTDSHGHVTTYEWNERGQVVRTTTPMGEVSSATFDSLGRLETETAATGELRVHGYDGLGRAVALTSSNGWERRRLYDDEHRVVSAQEWVTADNGEVVQTRALRMSYDSGGNIASAQNDELPAWHYGWTAFGELENVRDPAGAERHWAHDEVGNITWARNTEGHSWRWTHDSLGRVVTETDPVGSRRRAQYLDEDNLGIRIIDADGRVYERQASADDRVLRVTLPGGASRTTHMNTCGWPVSVSDEVGARTQLMWGSEPGELLRIVDANGSAYSFEYDADQRVVRRTTFDGRVLGTAWERGRVIATMDGAGQATELIYDSRGRTRKQVRVDGTTTFDFDLRGFLREMKSPEATLRFERDAAGRVIAEEQDGVRLTRSLDVMGRPVSYTSPYGDDTRFLWSQGGSLRGVRHGDAGIDFTRDALGREVGRELHRAGRFEQEYDPVGRLLSQTFAGHDGTAVQRGVAYDARGFLQSIHDSLRGATELRHNDRGDLTGVLRENGWSDIAAFDGCHNRVLYAHTEHGAALAEAFREAERSRQEGFGAPQDHEAIGRLPQVSTSQVYAPGNRVVSLRRPGGSRVDLAYDANGCIVSKVKQSAGRRDEWRFTWDSRQRMTSMTAPNGVVWTYRYDATSRRIEKVAPTGETWRYLWRGEDMAQVLHDGELVETYLHEPGGTCPLARIDGKGVRYILPDQNHGPSEEVGADGALEWAARKGTWGEGWRHHGHAGGQPFLGQWYDAESGLHYNRFRYYDPEVGRYLSPDPLELIAGTNTYSNVTDPFYGFDRHGLCPSTPDKPKPDTLSTTNGAIEATPGVTTTVLGNFGLDTDNIINVQLGLDPSEDFGPKPGGFNLLNVDNSLFDPKRPELFWEKYNKPFLDAAIARNDVIALATNPDPALMTRSDGSPTGYGREMTHLQDNGYHYDPVTRTMTR